MQPHIGDFLGELGITRETVHDAAGDVVFAEDSEAIGVGITVMDDDGEGEFLGEEELLLKPVFLGFGIGVVIGVVIKPDFADGEDFVGVLQG